MEIAKHRIKAAATLTQVKPAFRSLSSAAGPGSGAGRGGTWPSSPGNNARRSASAQPVSPLTPCPCDPTPTYSAVRTFPVPALCWQSRQERELRAPSKYSEDKLHQLERASAVTNRYREGVNEDTDQPGAGRGAAAAGETRPGTVTPRSAVAATARVGSSV